MWAITVLLLPHSVAASFSLNGQANHRLTILGCAREAHERRESMAREYVAKYVPGETFKCTKTKPLNVEYTEFSDPCGAEILIHGWWWCAQVCPVCLQNYHVGGTPMMLFEDVAGYYPDDVAARVRAQIAENGGQYVPRFK
jgi:hypothetical protein